MFACGLEQTLWWFMHRFKTETKSPVVHRNQCPGTEFEKCPDRFLRNHVNFAAGWRRVRTDRKQCKLNPVAIANVSKAGKVGAVARVENGSAGCYRDKSPEAAMYSRQTSGAPV